MWLISVNKDSSTYLAVVGFWINAFTDWTSCEVNNLSHLTIQVTTEWRTFWKPDTYFHNAAGNFFLEKIYIHMYLKSTKFFLQHSRVGFAGTHSGSYVLEHWHRSGCVPSQQPGHMVSSTILHTWSFSQCLCWNVKLKTLFIKTSPHSLQK